MRCVIDPDCRAKVIAATVPWMREDLGPRIAGRAQIYAPKDTGALAASVESHMDGTDLIVSAVGGDDGRSYAAYIELGHRVFHPSTGEVGPEWVPAEPFLRPALLGGFWTGPVGAHGGGTVPWRPEFGFGGDVRNSQSVRRAT